MKLHWPVDDLILLRRQRWTHWPLEGVRQQCNEEIHAENWREQKPCHKNNVSEHLIDGLHALKIHSQDKILSGKRIIIRSYYIRSYLISYEVKNNNNRDRQRQRQKDKERQRQKDKQRQRQKNKQRQWQMVKMMTMMLMTIIMIPATPLKKFKQILATSTATIYTNV